MHFTLLLSLIKMNFVLFLYRPKNVILSQFFLMYKNCCHPGCLFTIISSNFNSHEFLLPSLNLSQNELFSFLGKMFKQPGPRTAGISPPTTICARFTYGRPATLPKLPSLFVHGYWHGVQILGVRRNGSAVQRVRSILLFSRTNKRGYLMLTGSENQFKPEVRS